MCYRPLKTQCPGEAEVRSIGGAVEIGGVDGSVSVDSEGGAVAVFCQTANGKVHIQASVSVSLDEQGCAVAVLFDASLEHVTTCYLP